MDVSTKIGTGVGQSLTSGNLTAITGLLAEAISQYKVRGTFAEFAIPDKLEPTSGWISLTARLVDAGRLDKLVNIDGLTYCSPPEPMLATGTPLMARKFP